MAITSIKTGSSFTNLQKYNNFLGPNSAFIPTSFESIATATGTGSSGTITFSSIPSTYSSLQIRYLAISDGAGPVVSARFNGVSSSIYVQHYLQGTGAAAQADYDAAKNSMSIGDKYTGIANGTYPYVGIVDILDYASTTKNKTVRTLSGIDKNGSGSISLISGLSMATTAVSSITILISGGNFTTASTFALYGIK
jgi:hypothetical protein